MSHNMDYIWDYKGSMVFRDTKALGCSVPSAARALLRA